MKFYLGTHMSNWLGTVDVPLFVSHRRLLKRKRFPRAVTVWALDSGGFTELKLFGGWRTTEADYIQAVRRYRDEIGLLEWASPMDWMCEPFMLSKTGLTVREHQQRTVENFLSLRTAAPDLPFIPVLQGWEESDYHQCVDIYSSAGIDLSTLPLVGIGSVCRRQHTKEIGQIISGIAQRGISLHGFGVKQLGLQKYAWALASADSMAWSYRARNRPALPGHTHKSCGNCPTFALQWRERVLNGYEGHWQQPTLPGRAA
jgi:hypothetical protein